MDQEPLDHIENGQLLLVVVVNTAEETPPQKSIQSKNTDFLQSKRISSTSSHRSLSANRWLSMGAGDPDSSQKIQAIDKNVESVSILFLLGLISEGELGYANEQKLIQFEHQIWKRW